MIVVVLIIILFALMARVFKTVPVPYTSSPADEGIPFETVHFNTSRGLRLHAWWIPGEEGDGRPVVILVHGWRRNAERMMPYIKALHSHYKLLVFDSRNHGKSESDNFTSMPKFTEDILAALNYIDTKEDCRGGSRSLLGLSMGGGAAIYAAAQDQRINNVVTIGAFANPEDIMVREYRKRYIPYFPLVYILHVYFQWRIGVRFKEFAPENQIKYSDARFLIIHGEKDETTPFSHAERLLAASKDSRTELYSMKEAGHSNCHTFTGFWEKIIGFLRNSNA